uniref:Uncharacterized protein n=1 Tax=Schistocephalus solidus TaxID=70667 RepID=A0A0V0J1H9_SCHSO
MSHSRRRNCSTCRMQSLCYCTSLVQLTTPLSSRLFASGALIAYWPACGSLSAEISSPALEVGVTIGRPSGSPELALENAFARAILGWLIALANTRAAQSNEQNANYRV